MICLIILQNYKKYRRYGQHSGLTRLPPRSFSLIVHIHAPVEPFLHFVKKIGTAVVLAQFEV